MIYCEVSRILFCDSLRCEYLRHYSPILHLAIKRKLPISPADFAHFFVGGFLANRILSNFYLLSFMSLLFAPIGPISLRLAFLVGLIPSDNSLVCLIPLKFGSYWFYLFRFDFLALMRWIFKILSFFLTFLTFWPSWDKSSMVFLLF